jgi:hypothetical protein
MSQIKYGACHHIYLGCHSTSLGGHPKHPYSIGWHLQYKTDGAPLNPVTRHKPNKIAGLLGLKGRPIQQGGHMPTATERTTKKDIIKIGTTDVVIQKENEGPMIFGESANTNETEDTTAIKISDTKYSMPRWCPSGLTWSQKRKLHRLRAKENQEKEAEKIFNDTHPQYPPPQKKWRPKAVEEKQTTTKIEKWGPKAIEEKQTTTQIQNKITIVQHPTGMADSPAKKAKPFAQGTDRPTRESGPSAPHQDASDDVPTPMEQDDLLGEDLVDYEASPERLGMDVNIITFSAACTIVGDDEPVVVQFYCGPKEAAFTKPKESVNHLKPLFVRGHIDGISIAKMLVDGGRL